MIYYYLTGEILNITPTFNMVRKHSIHNYASRSPNKTISHIVNGNIVDQEHIVSDDHEEVRKKSSEIVRRMLQNTYRKSRKSKPKVKKCGCKK